MLSVMEIVRCAVNCTFKPSFSHEPVIKPNLSSHGYLKMGARDGLAYSRTTRATADRSGSSS